MNLKQLRKIIESEETTYRVTNSHHNIATSVKATSSKEAREKAVSVDKKYSHKATEASPSWSKD
jgi:hypothetical protein